MNKRKKANNSHAFHSEGSSVVFDKPKSPEEIARDEQHEFARKQVNTNKWLAWFTGALVLATFCTIGVGVWQACISRTAAKAAESAANTARDTLTASNRAWVEARTAPPWSDDIKTENQSLLPKWNEISIPFVLTNIGKVPVTDFKAEAAIEILDQNQPPSFFYNIRHNTISANILFPSRSIPLTASLLSDGEAALYSRGRAVGEPEKVSSELRSDLQSGIKYIVAYGQGQYTDQTGEHWFRFCRFLGFASTPRSYPTRTCVDYNSIGDVPENQN